MSDKERSMIETMNDETAFLKKQKLIIQDGNKQKTPNYQQKRKD